MKKSKRLVSLLLAAMFTVGTLAGCSSGGTSSGAGGTPSGSGEAHADSLVIATQSEPASLTTYDHDSLIGVSMNILTYNGLMRIDQGTLKTEYDLAESHTVENDVDWIFKLKQGVKFHDGTELHAEDVVATIEWVKANVPGSSGYTGKIASVEEVDEYTVKITTDGPYAGLLYDLGYHYNFIMPKALIESGNDFNTNPVGTGPYKFVEWSHGDHITFTKNEDYFDETCKPSITELTWRFIPEGTSRTIALEAGEVDFVYEVETTDVSRLQSNSAFTVAEVTSVENWFLNLNKDLAPFDDVNVRKAINCAINRDNIINGALNGYAKANISCVPVGYAEYSDEGAEGYDLEKAKEYLAAWGGDPSTISLPILCSNDVKVRIATIMQADLAEIGINVEVVSMDQATYLSQTSSGDFTAAITSWSPSNALTYLQRYHSRRRASNPGSLNDPEVDALVEQAESTIDEAARTELLHEIIVKVNGLVPQPTLYQSVNFRAFDARLKGVVPSATGYVDFHRCYWEA